MMAVQKCSLDGEPILFDLDPIFTKMKSACAFIGIYHHTYLQIVYLKLEARVEMRQTDRQNQLHTPFTLGED